MIAIGSDHRGYKIKEEIKKYLDEKEIKYIDYGTGSEERVDYPVIAKKVARSIQEKECDLGILICGTGFGMSIVANKFKGIRCTPCYDEETARLAKQHNNANILALGAEKLNISEAVQMIRAWIGSDFLGERHSQRLEMIEEIEQENMK